MKHLYKEQNTFRILPINFMHNLGILLKYDDWDSEVLPLIENYYEWAMGHEMNHEQGKSVYKAFMLLGDKMNLQDYEARLEVWYRFNAK